MSADATAWTYRHSPCTGANFQVHQAIADSVNDLHHNEFWMSAKNLAIKARVSERTARTALHDLREMGLIELLEERRHAPSRYRFLFPEVAVVYETRSATTAGLPSPRAATTAARAANDREIRPEGLQPLQPIPTNDLTQEEPNGVAASPRRATAFPAEFFITAEMRAWAQEKVPSVDVHAETEQFCDWHRAKGDTAKDWVASWRTWMRNAVKYARAGRKDRDPRSQAEIIGAAAASVQARRDAGLPSLFAIPGSGG